MKIPFVIAALVCAANLFAQDTRQRVSEIVRGELDSLVELYQYLHAHPELSYYEKETAAKLISELKPLGYEVTAGIGGHGFAAVMKNGAGPTVMVRTDLDGLPVVEKTGLSYSSDVRVKDDLGNDVGVMHACGHDIHMSTFVGVARSLSKMKDAWKGTLIMLGQPAEERGAGARAMLKDGLFEKFPYPDFVLALHSSPVLAAGAIGYYPGYAMANVDSVDITIRGVGGHGAYPHAAKDPVVIAAQVIMSLQTIVSRELKPIEAGVVTVGSIHGGSKHNIISDEVKLQLTVRSYSDETRQQILDAIRRITVGVARTAGVPADREPTIKVAEEEYTPATYNNPALVSRLLPVWNNVLGEHRVIEAEPQMGGEDFSRYGRTDPKIPINMMWLGTIDPGQFAESQKPGGQPLASLHSAYYAPAPRPSIETGVKVMTASVLELMN